MGNSKIVTQLAKHLNNGLKGKLFLLTFSFVALILANFLASSFLIKNKQADEKVIALAARQGVLTESYLKNFFYFMETQKIDSVTVVIKEFENNLATLKRENKDVTLVIPGGNSHLEMVERISSNWESLKKSAVKLLGASGDAKKRGFESLISEARELSKLTRGLENHFSQLSQQNFVNINRAQTQMIRIVVIQTDFVSLMLSPKLLQFP